MMILPDAVKKSVIHDSTLSTVTNLTELELQVDLSTYLSVDERRQRQVVKEIGEILPDVGVAVLAQTLIIEPIHLSDLTTLVVTSQDCDPVLEPHLKYTTSTLPTQTT